MRNAYFRPIGRPTAAVLLVLLAGCAAQSPPVVAPAPEPIAVEPAAQAEPVAAPAPEPDRAPAPSIAPARPEIALVLDARTPAHTSVANEIEAALSPRRYRVTRFASTDLAALAALRGRPVTIVAVGDGAVQAARAELPNRPLVFCQVPDADAALREAERFGAFSRYRR